MYCMLFTQSVKFTFVAVVVVLWKPFNILWYLQCALGRILCILQYKLPEFYSAFKSSLFFRVICFRS